MQIKTAKAAILAESRKPLIVDEIALPEALGVGQVLVKVLLHHHLRRPAQRDRRRQGPGQVPAPSARPRSVRPPCSRPAPASRNVKPGDTVVLHWRPSLGIQCTPPAYRWRGKKLNAGWVTTFNDYAVVSENRMTVIPASFDLKIAPLLGCAVTTAAGVINNDAKTQDRRVGRRVRRRRRRA